MKKILIRADSNAGMGVGHVMRSVALAQYLIRQNVHVRFLTVTESLELSNYLKKQKFETCFMKSKEEDSKVQSILHQLDRDFDWVILDHSGFQEKDHQKIIDFSVHLLTISDGSPYSKCVDLVVNHALQDSNFRSGDKRYLFGTKFALIREELLRVSKREKKRNQNLLITLGGGDFSNLLKKLIHSINLLTEIQLNVKVLCGFSMEPHAIQMKSHHQIEYQQASSEIQTLLDWADLSMSAAGGTVWELCFYGVTGLIGIVADNQVQIAQNLNEQGIFKSVGWYRDISETFLADELRKLLKNSNVLEQMRSKAQGLVDGKGPERIFEAMQKVEYVKPKT